MTHKLQVEDFFNPPAESHSKFLSGCFANRQDLNLYTYAWLPKHTKPTYVPSLVAFVFALF
jgi:hypothetical protein